MPLYVTLFKLTDQGARNIKEAPQRHEAADKVAEAAGLKTLGFYVTMGDYDYVGIAEAPNDEAYAAFMLGVAAQGNVRTTTLKAFTMEDMAKIVEKLS
jgi:uncharacterized protein with GYD domain